MPRALWSWLLPARLPHMAAAGVLAVLPGCTDPSNAPVGAELSSPQHTAATPHKSSRGAIDVGPLAAAHNADPANRAAALAYAKALRASGAHAEALAVLDKAAKAHATDRRLMFERGLLALESGDPGRAESLLRQAHDPSAPDWRLHSALGVALASRGKQQEAQAQFAKALTLAPNHPTVLNNLALSYTLDGKTDEAEKLLRSAQRSAAKPGEDGTDKVQQNLALVLGLRGKYGEAQSVAVATLPAAKASSNVSYLKQLAEARGASSTKAEAADPASSSSKVSASLPQPTYQLKGPAAPQP